MFEYNRNINRAKRYSFNNNNSNNQNNNNSNQISKSESSQLEIKEESYRSEIVDLYESSLSPRKFYEEELQELCCQGIKLTHDAVIFDRVKMTNEHLKELYKNQGLIVGEYFAFLAPMVFVAHLMLFSINIFSGQSSFKPARKITRPRNKSRTRTSEIIRQRNPAKTRRSQNRGQRRKQ